MRGNLKIGRENGNGFFAPNITAFSWRNLFQGFRASACAPAQLDKNAATRQTARKTPHQETRPVILAPWQLPAMESVGTATTTTPACRARDATTSRPIRNA